MQEVVDMTPELKAFAGRDGGFRQFCDRYQFVATDPETRDIYLNWLNERIHRNSVEKEIENKGVAKGQKMERAKNAKERAELKVKIAEKDAAIAALSKRIEKLEKASGKKS
jgi:hypothetical protein